MEAGLGSGNNDGGHAALKDNEQTVSLKREGRSGEGVGVRRGE